MLQNLAYVGGVQMIDCKLLKNNSAAFREVYRELFQSDLSTACQNDEVARLKSTAPDEGNRKAVARPNCEIPKNVLKERRGLDLHGLILPVCLVRPVGHYTAEKANLTCSRCSGLMEFH